MTANTSSQNGHPQTLTRVILVGAPELDRPLRRDTRIELTRAQDSFQALGELGSNDSSCAAPPAVVLGTSALKSIDPDALASAMRVVNPGARLFAVSDNGDTPASNAAEWVREDELPSALFGEREPAHAAPVISEPKKPRKKDKKKNKRKKAVLQEQPFFAPGDERTILRIILSGGDPLSEIIGRVSNAVGNDQIEFIRSIESDETPKLAGGFAAVRVSRRSHTYGWLVGPDALEPKLKEQAESVALWLSLSDQHAQLRALAFTDSLTGAWNRRYFDKYLNSAIHEARAKRHNLTLMIFDIDDFKQYNDEYGHAAGDEILTETIRLLKSYVRPNDKVCRIGGDEFAVIFYDPSGPRDPASHHPRSIFKIARRFQKQIADHHFPKLAERAKGSLTISGGLATFPWDAHDVEELIERADHLALVSKKHGKNVLTIGNSPEEQDPSDSDGNTIDLPKDNF